MILIFYFYFLFKKSKFPSDACERGMFKMNQFTRMNQNSTVAKEIECV